MSERGGCTTAAQQGGTKGVHPLPHPTAPGRSLSTGAVQSQERLRDAVCGAAVITGVLP